MMMLVHEHTRIFRGPGYAVKAHPKSCFFCQHLTDIFYDYTKPKTHRDMLRSKSDEELAAWFRVVADCEGCPAVENFDECRHGKDCEDKWLEWLRGEAKEEP